MKESVKKWGKPIYNLGKRVLYSAAGGLHNLGISADGNFKRLQSYQNAHKGERCFLVGTGPSLVPEDLDKIQGEKAFGCNMLYKLYPKTSWRPDYYCMTDRVYAKYQSQEMLKHVEAPVFTPKSAYRRMPVHGEQVIYVNDIYDYNTYKPRGKMLSYCWLKASVMLFMLEMAVYMGFTEIYLLGVDCTNTYRPDGHFTKDYVKDDAKAAEKERLESDLKKEKMTPEEMWAHNYRRNIEAYEEIAKFAQKKGISIYNATRGGNLEVFPRVALEEIPGV
ncbi:MAG: 6-hydroxymethylpterin diphosphokinase MptE-like protein [Blautia sp.]|jgi:hypothetical protein